MGARIDHLILACPDPDATAERLSERTGVPIPVGGRHPDWGTRNRILALGDDRYLELMGPDPEWEGDGPRLFEIDRLAEDRLLTWAAATDDPERDRNLIAGAGIEPGGILEGERIRPDGSRLSWRLTDPRTPRLDRMIPFLIQWDGDAHPGRVSTGCRLGRVEIVHPERERVAAVLEALGIEGVRVTAGDRPSLRAELRTPRGTVEVG